MFQLDGNREELVELSVGSDHVIAVRRMAESHTERSKRKLRRCRDKRQERGTDRQEEWNHPSLSCLTSFLLTLKSTN